ncbi:MAG: PDZ domain-containing protein [Saprospiraceae bacterium]|nr:PDZ domain-containing protein [Saprospiraceae bacterium]
MKNYGVILGSSLVSAVLAVILYAQFVQPQQVIVRESVKPLYASLKNSPLLEKNTRPYTASTPTSFSNAAESVTPAVVNIRASASGEYDIWGGYGASTGSGVIISPDGLIVTNNHVIEDSQELIVTLSDKRKYSAKVLGKDDNTDLALLKVDATELPFLRFGNSDAVRVGEWVMAVGNPFNLESTVTAGIVSAKGRSIDILEGEYKIESFIQTDAAVNPGNSGGALVNTKGELIGINTAIITRSGRYEGYSFAIPMNLAEKIIRDLSDFGVVQRGILGIGIGDLTDEKAKEVGLSSVEGVLITRVTPKSGASDAGLKRGDVIIAVNNNKTSTVPELQEQIALFRPGNLVDVRYYRNGKFLEAQVVLKNKSNTTDLVGAGVDKSLLQEVGFELRDLNSFEKQRLQINGVKVISVYRGSTIEKTNMDPDFVITKINDVVVDSVQDVVRVLKSSGDGKVLLEGIYEEYQGEYYYDFILEEK